MNHLKLLLVVLFLSSPLLAGELVVIESDYDGLPEGTLVDGAQPLILPAGANVNLVAESGEVVSLQGPYKGRPGGGAGGGEPALLGQLAALFNEDTTDEAAVGATRGLTLGIAANRTPDDPWMLDVLSAGDHCVAGEDGVVMWRRRTSPGERLTMWLATAADDPHTVTWPIGETMLPWPTELPITDSGVYYAYSVSDDKTRHWTLHQVPAGFPSEAHRAAWMANSGCRQQAKILLRSLTP